jgi:hypothetical protein
MLQQEVPPVAQAGGRPTFFCLADSTASKKIKGLKKIKLYLEDDEQTVIGKITSETQDAAGISIGFPEFTIILYM